jgi:hypothetical protein
MSNGNKFGSRTSRFSELKEEIKYEETNRYNRRSEMRDGSFKSLTTRQSSNFIDKSLQDSIRKEKELRESLSIENFPQLVPTKKNYLECNNLEIFSDKVKANINTTSDGSCIDEDLELIPCGWTFVKNDPLTHCALIKRKNTNVKDDENEYDKEFFRKKNGLVKLTRLYEKRRDNYINSWGVEEYNFMYKFPNYDYEYFDKLDELYEDVNYTKDSENADYDYEYDFDYDYINDHNYDETYY